MNTQIVIRGRQFNVRTLDDGQAIKDAAAELDRRLTEQAQRSRSFDEHSVVVITALNLIAEMQMIRQEHDEHLEIIQHEIFDLQAMLEEVLTKEKD